ncbi:MAG TPA: DUF2079 domain-containing protein [Polyangiaceae bacterium]|jgi:uncharacterized membrane protein|nr:DUF2079 domain-containing protein [Polyangiaceae bacterium]
MAVPVAPELALPKAPRIAGAAPHVDGVAPPLSVSCRALMILFGLGLSVGFGLGFILLKDPLGPYLTNNDMRPALRRFVLATGFGTGGAVAVFALFAAYRLRKTAPMSGTLRRAAHRFAPVGVVGFLPLLFQWKAWQGRDVEFLSLVALAAMVLQAGVRARLAAEPFGPEVAAGAKLRRRLSDLAARFPRAAERAPLFVVCAGALAYTIHFSYYTIAWHHSVRSGYDLALENNLVWNIVHGGQFYKSAPLVGPVGSHFGYHAALLAYFIAPFYAFYQHPETLYVIQAGLLGAAAIPLFLYARLYLSAGAACVLALAYLMCPGVHGANLYEYHYLPLSTFFLWLTLYALESRRNVLAVIAVVLTLSVREDVSAALVIWGIYLLVSGKRPRAGLIVAAVAGTYFLLLKMVLMPRYLGGESFTFIYQKLLPSGENSFGAVLKTVVGNPWYTVGTLLEQDKLVYALQMLVPLALVPLRRPLTMVFALPGFLFTMLSTGYSPTLSIHYQYTAHWTTFMFVATVLVLASLDAIGRRAALWAISFAMLACSYQYGAVLQKNTSVGGPIPYKFGMDREGHERRVALDKVLESLPATAKVSCSAFTTPQVSSRADAYSMTLGLYDAEYILFPTVHADFIGNEYSTVSGLLQDKTFGIVAADKPFALARRGQNPARNAEVLAMMR